MEIKWAVRCLESCAHKLTSRQQGAVQTLKAAVLGTTANSASTKLPLMRFEVYAELGCPITEVEGVATIRYRRIVDDVYNLLERQLRAGG